jgi:hypothetical protein
MATLLPPNQFEFVASDAAADQAVASIPCPLAQDAAADHSDSGATDCAPDEAAAPFRHVDGAAVEYPDIGEIFVGAEKLNDPEARFVLDEQAFMDAIDEPPLFLRQAV